MRSNRTTLKSHLRLLTTAIAISCAMPWTAALAQADPVAEALKAGDLTKAETTARAQLKEVETLIAAPAATSAQANDLSMRKRQAQTALATVLSAQAWEADDRYRSKRIAGNDIIALIVLALLAGSILMIVLRYGPQKPKIVEQIAERAEKVKTEQRDDSLRQTGAAFFSLLILGVAGAVIFGAGWMTLHLVAEIERANADNPKARAAYDEAKKLMSEARAQKNPPVVFEDYDVLTLYSTFLSKTGNAKLSNAVTMRAIALRNRSSRCNLQTGQRTP